MKKFSPKRRIKKDQKERSQYAVMKRNQRRALRLALKILDRQSRPAPYHLLDSNLP